jgi:hypothetical protein
MLGLPIIGIGEGLVSVISMREPVSMWNMPGRSIS